MHRKRNFQVILALFLLVQASLTGQTWDLMQVEKGTKPSIVVDAVDKVHIAYLKEGFSSGYIGYLTLEGDSIKADRFVQGGFEGPLAFGLTRGGFPNILVHDHASENQMFFTFSTIGWIGEQINSTNHDGWDNSLYYDSEGKVHTASTDAIDGLEYSYRIGEEWVKETLPTGGVMYNEGTSIVLDNNDLPHIAYYHMGNDRLEYAYNDGNDWNIEVIEDQASFATMTKDNTDHMIVAYLARIDLTTSVVKVAKQVGPNWVSESIDTLFNMGPIAQHSTSIIIDSNQNAHIAYSDRQYVKYAREVGNIWVIDTVLFEPGSPGVVGAQCDLKLDSQDDPHIVFYLQPERVIYAHAEIGSTAVDMDNDGYDDTVDCDDDNPAINPGAEEILDNDIDEDCDGEAEQSMRVTVTGRFTNREGIGIANVQIRSSDVDIPTIISDNDGRWEIPDIRRNTRLTFIKEDNVRNGLSAQDLVLTRNHILRQILLNEDDQKASDSNGNGSLSVSDIVISTNILLGRQDRFPNGLSSWIFEPSEVELDPETAPNFIPVKGIKLGDTSGNADPKSN